MTTSIYKSMLTQILTPVVVVIAFWIGMSLSTTYFLVWTERSNHRVFLENVVSVRAAEALRIAVWRLMSDYPLEFDQVQNFRSRFPDHKNAILTQQNALQQSASEGEQTEMQRLDEALAGFFSCFDRLSNINEEAREGSSSVLDLEAERRRANDFANRIDVSAEALFDFNQAVVDQYRSERNRLNSRVITTRWAAMVLGPILGVFLGWRVGNRLHRSITQIAVTLHDVGSLSDSEVGVVDIDSSGDFKDVEQQAEKVAERMRMVSRELHAARSEVLRSERLAAVGELAAGVAHEIRNPLTSVKLLLQHAIRQVSGPNLDAGKVRLILDEIGRMEKTIQGLLDFSRPPKLNRVQHDFRQTLQRALNLVDARSRQQQIEIETHICDSPLMVDGDTEKLHQLLVNLLINAVEAMPQGGHLSIDASLQTKHKSKETWANSLENGESCDGTMAEIIIRDTGEGIANDVLPRLFEPFATTKERGTGLGLAVSHRIAEEHCGTIRATNDPNGGAQFTLTIPVVNNSIEVCTPGHSSSRL